MADVNKYRFSSEEWDSNAGLYYYGYRFYDPNLQRWLNQDPIQEWGEINLFAFVGNSPLNWVDLFGECPAAAAAATTLTGSGEALGAAGALATAADMAGQVAVGSMVYGPYITGVGNWYETNPNGVNAPPPSVTSPLPMSSTPSYPPVPVPGAPDIPWVQNGPQRDGVPTFRPATPVPSEMGGQPSASWDPDGHWDVEDGQGNRQRYDWRGNPLDPSQAQDPDAPQPPGNNPCPN